VYGKYGRVGRSNDNDKYPNGNRSRNNMC
jgi:hypothetical protein